jgi:hypothetical protein
VLIVQTPIVTELRRANPYVGTIAVAGLGQRELVAASLLAVALIASRT